MSTSPDHVKTLLGGACDEWLSLAEQCRKLAGPLREAAALMASTWEQGGKLIICGNGGSCADAMHFAEELVARFQKNRRALAAIALADPTVMTCIGNDFGYDSLFSRQVEALGRPEDLLVLLSTSGNSANCVAALDVARERKMKTMSFLGKSGGALKGQCDVELHVPAETAHRVQEGHKLLFHTLCEWADAWAGA